MVKELFQKEIDFDELKIDEWLMDDGKNYDVFMPLKPKDRLVYKNGFCEFTPVGYVRMTGGWFPIGYKVVTHDLMSLGLRNNPTPMKFPIGEWTFEERSLQYGDKDFGGIWSAYRAGSLKTLKKHCLETWGMETRGFLTAIYNPVAFVGNYRIKSQGVMLLKEI